MLTLGSLIDQYTIVLLKNFYADTDSKKTSTSLQKFKMVSAISDFLDHFKGWLPLPRYISAEFPQNKVYSQETIEFGSPSEDASIIELIKTLASINHNMWRNQEYVYDFKSVPISKKDEVINRCATLNIERSQFMDAINKKFLSIKRNDVVALEFELISYLDKLDEQIDTEYRILQSAKYVG